MIWSNMINESYLWCFVEVTGDGDIEEREANECVMVIRADLMAAWAIRHIK